MNCNRFLNSFAVLLVTIVLVPSIFSQAPKQTPANEPAPQVMTEDDRLPFMQSEDTPAPQEPSSGGLILKSIGALLLVIGLLFFGTWTLKKLGIGNGKGKSGEELNLTVLSTLSMGNGRTISTIRFGERVLLVGATPQNFTLLAEEQPLSDEVYSRNPRSVAELLEDEEPSFDDEFEIAQQKLNMWQTRGGAA
ncbi:MAG: flagellar biosynthetic protein FliO [Pyrinomonadaceae bacterium]